MYRAITLIVMLCLTFGLVGCESAQSTGCYVVPAAKPLRSTVFNSQRQLALAQSTWSIYQPTSPKWYHTRNDITPSVFAGYITEQSEQQVTITRNRNDSNRDDYERTTYSRRQQKLSW
ncbi:MAG: hypothetical protein JKX85_16145 [Phycisphaeraceae bacterium]|nr:hypothetical protein [Phycisphaeraceae bacterium]